MRQRRVTGYVTLALLAVLVLQGTNAFRDPTWWRWARVAVLLGLVVVWFRARRIQAVRGRRRRLATSS